MQRIVKKWANEPGNASLEDLRYEKLHQRWWNSCPMAACRRAMKSISDDERQISTPYPFLAGAARGAVERTFDRSNSLRLLRVHHDKCADVDEAFANFRAVTIPLLELKKFVASNG